MGKISVSIQETSNERIIKFQANSFLTDHESFEYNNIDEANNSPLAQQLFYLPFVKKVYISVNFVAIERFDIVKWDDVKQEVAEQIEEYLNAGGTVVNATSSKKLPITVYAESTPNPAVIKFVANKKIVPQTIEFKSIDEAKVSPFATELFHYPFVKSVFIDENYVSITKYDIAEWNDVTMELREFIKAYLENDKAVLLQSESNLTAEAPKSEKAKEPILDSTSQQIVSILDEYIKPAVASDGGNIVFESYDPKEKSVKVILQGACSGCPSSTFTLKNGIENMLKEMLHGKVETVEAING